MSNSGGTNAHKDVIYIDVDDEITGIIDKVRGSSQKIVALVLPKRATVLQSVVNMKLLKRTADHTKKNVVLITSEAGLLPLAGSVGMHVARTLNSKPEIPEAPDRDDAPEAIEEMSGPDEGDTKSATASSAAKEKSIDRSKTVGELAGAAAVESELDDTIDLDAEEELPEARDKQSKAEKGKNKKFKIPNFNKFRVVLILAVVVVFLLGGFAYAAVAVMPKAKVTIKTDSTAINTSSVVILKTGPEVQLDVEKSIVPAQSQETKKTATQQVPATGQQNNGEKATGSIDMTAKNCTSLATPKDVPAGTGVTANGKTYITTEKASFSGSGTFDGSCLNFKDSNVGIVAQTGGASFNVTSANFTVAGRSDVTGVGSAAGGTDDIIKIVIQADIDSAKQKIGEQDTETIRQELKSGLIDRDLFAIDATFGSAEPETKLSTEANQPADNVTVTQTITYSMLGVKQADLEKIVERQAKDKIDTQKQSIQNFGIDKAVFGLQTKEADGSTVTMQATALTGAELDAGTIKKQVAGKKAADAKKIIKANPGVTDVKVEYSPFWVGSIPNKTSKITVIIQEPQVTAENEQSNP